MFYGNFWGINQKLGHVESVQCQTPNTPISWAAPVDDYEESPRHPRIALQTVGYPADVSHVATLDYWARFQNISLEDNGRCGMLGWCRAIAI